jgi:hypothetical protein
MYKSVRRSLTALSLILLMICGTGLLARSPQITKSNPQSGNAPLRLRLKVENNTLRSGQTTRISAEFLDQRYQQVPNDGTRIVEFGIAAVKGQTTGRGDIRPPQVKVTRGVWTADAVFKSTQPGKVIITARADGLDPTQTILLVTKPPASMLSQLFETVAYADAFEGFDLWWQSLLEAQANNTSKATFQVTFSEPPPVGTKVRVRVDPPAAILYNGVNRGTQTEVTLGEGKGISENIDVISGRPAIVSVKARILPSGPERGASVKFTAPRPSRIIFDDDLRDIISTQHTVPISVQLTDESGNALESDAERSITLKPANEDDPIEFEPPSVLFSPNQRFAQSILHLKGLPGGNELTFLAISKDPSLKVGRKTIIIRSPIERVTVAGPFEVLRGNASAEFTVKLTDKAGKPMAADWDRKINLSATTGTLSQTQITIPRGLDEVKVQYVSSNASGKATLRAESLGLADGTLEVALITALYWLVFAALLGGFVGGVVRHIPGDFKLERILPKWTGECWELGLVGRVFVSICCGLFLYLALKLGLARAFGSLELPAGLDLGTRRVAFFFGGIGGFAGTVVFDRLVSWILPAPRKEQTQTASSAAN